VGTPFLTTFGIPEFLARNQKTREVAGPAVEAALIEVGELILEESNKLCPIVTGDLRESGEVQQSGHGFATRIRVVYTASYAVYVHENLDAYHEPPTQAKFLEETLRRNRKDIQRAIREGVVDTIKKARS